MYLSSIWTEKKDYRISIRRACCIIMLSTSVYYYKPHPREDRVIRSRIRENSEVRIRYEFWRIFTLLRREGWKDNHKRVYRIYKEEGLNLRTKRPRRRKCGRSTK